MKISRPEIQYVNKGSSITWDKAKQEAEGMTYFGRQGYLVTITDAKENEFVKEKTLGLGWIGAQDIERKDGGPRKTGDWRWVTGPEGEKDSGNGLKFYEGYYQTSGKPVDGAYTNWDAQEPNDYSNKEYVAHIFSSGQQAGKWNDYPNDNNVEGYVIEFGGMPNDTNNEIIAEKSVAFVNITDLKKTVEQLDQLKEEDYMEDEWPAGSKLQVPSAFTFTVGVPITLPSLSLITAVTSAPGAASPLNSGLAMYAWLPAGCLILIRVFS